MKRRDVSFTFLHRVEEVESNLEDGRWQSALALALTLPDICGGIAFPEYVKRYRDGRVMLDKQKNPTRDVGTQYVSWFDTYAAPFFKQSPKDEAPYICGNRCWQLRCEYLHQNKGFVNEEEETEVHFHLGVNCGTSICQQEKVVTINGNRMDIRIDIEQFCWRMCQASRSYYEQFHKEKDFGLYNTPVLDFIQSNQSVYSDKMIVIISVNDIYSKSIAMALDGITTRIQRFKTMEEAKSKLKKAKPDAWLIVDSDTKSSDRPWWLHKNSPVILLAKNENDERYKEAKNEQLTILNTPVLLEDLRKRVRDYMR